LVFLTVTLGLVGGYLAWSGFFHPDASRVRRRLADEFAKDQPKTAPSVLYKNLDPLKLSLDQAPFDPVDRSLAAPAAAKPSVLQRLDSLLEQSNLPLTVNQCLAAAACVAFAFGTVGAWFGGWIAGLAASLLGAAAPLFLVQWRRRARQESYLRMLP